MSSLYHLKREIRYNLLKKRDEISPSQHTRFSLAAARNANKINALSNGKNISGTIISAFNSIHSEIDTRPLISSLLKRKARLCLPVVIDSIRIEFREISEDMKLIKSRLDTFGPPLNPEILVIPLSGFDRRGGRIGYGAGLYDRAIIKLRTQIYSQKSVIKPLLCGFAFSIQEVQKIPMDKHDQFLDYIVTEIEVIDCLLYRKIKGYEGGFDLCEFSS
ncbi:5-formyltetrahydrofolate cyclo-ligase [Candidatus Endowatersipora endosymbiont of Watersipora subatra]|uniref:5-formyltetrahydrofolate cyclo-ligase n=1 Tax=Candidatus Endowatersipora endosymbiont of Watersipora subatra TaxID=3077946 RepID=UPI00312C8A11